MSATPATGPGLADTLRDRLDASPFALMLDVDGTLAPIAPTPREARVPEGTRAILTRLARSPGVALALVSGRSAEDAWRVAGVDGAWVIGNHGLELRLPTGELTAGPEARSFEPAVSSAATLLADRLEHVTGVIVENKRWTLSVHYRLVEPARAPEVIELAEEVADANGLRVFGGKMIVELRPPLEIDKGTASVAFAERVGVGRSIGCALYAGDDRTDEDAFRALRTWNPGAVTVRIGSAEDRDDRSDAEFALVSVDELREFLQWLAIRRGRAGV